MRIAITGSSGLVGQALTELLRSRGDEITRLVRPGSRASGVSWDPRQGEIDLAGLEGHDAVVNLAGESLFGLWTAGKRRRIRDSRVLGTNLLATSLGKLSRPPSVLISASAIGFYGDHPDGEQIAEGAPKGLGFLADVAAEWEAAAVRAAGTGMRVVLARFGLVLSPKGGALASMLPVFKAGLGARIGSGRQYWSWVTIDDVVQIIDAAIRNPAIEGPINVVAPRPVTNAQFTHTLGRVLSRPAWLPAPAAVLKVVAGDMAAELLLSGARVIPRKLQEVGYVFSHPELEPALRDVLGGR